MGEDKKELLIRRSLKRVRLCTQHSNSFSPKRMQWPMTYTSNCLFKSLQPEVWWADPNPKQTPDRPPGSCCSPDLACLRTRQDMDQRSWNLATSSSLAAAILAQGPCGLFYFRVASSIPTSHHSLFSPGAEKF